MENVICRFLKKATQKLLGILGVVGWRIMRENFIVLKRTTNGRPYIENGENDVQIHHQPVGATCGRPPLVLPQKVIETP